MSRAVTRYALSNAAEWAIGAEAVVEVHAPLVAIAGSIRRKRDDVGDVDLVVLDDTVRNPWQHSAIARDLAGILGYEQTKDGEKIASFRHPTRCPLDLYYATPETWGITLLVRTGSAGHNIFLAEYGRKQLPACRLSVARGILNTADIVVASRTEEDCFKALGLAYVPPDLREAPAFDAMVRADE